MSNRRPPPEIDPALLDGLLADRAPAPLAAIARRLGVTVQEAVARVEGLRLAGCVIDSHPQHGVLLREAGLACWADYLRWALTPPERLIEVYRTVGSTQDAARRTVDAAGPRADRAVVVADEQTRGRGRLGRHWVAPPGAALTFSYVRCEGPDHASDPADRLTLAAAVALAEAAEAVADLPERTVQIKWPNDLLLNGRKLAGILVERFAIRPNGHADVIGVGINVRQTPEQVTDGPGLQRLGGISLAMGGADADRLRLLTEAIRRLDHAVASTDPEPIAARWRSRCPMLSKDATFTCGGHTTRGKVIDIDPRRGLIVLTTSGSLTHLPAATTTVL